MIKLKPEDFEVKEIIALKEGKGRYLYVQVEKTNWNTLDLVNKLSDILNISRKNIGFAGYKDKNAVTVQYFSLFNVDKNRIKNIRIKDVKLKALFYGDLPIYIGALKENSFKIIVRDLNERKKLEISFIENYFDDQRFGNKLNNHLVGEALLKRDFKKAVELIDDNKLNEYISRKKNDFVGALKLLDFKMINFYISAFQSYLFNEVLKEYLKDYDNFKAKYSIGEFLFLKNRIKNFKISLVNFDFEFGKDKISLFYKKLLKDIELESFIFKEFPYSVSYSVERDAFADVKDFKYKYGKDELNKGKYKAILEFTLPTGSYATVVIKKLFPENL